MSAGDDRIDVFDRAHRGVVVQVEGLALSEEARTSATGDCA
jgi:hypothetical protein